MERTKGLGRGDDTTAFRRVSRQWPRRFIVMLQRHVGMRDRATVSCASAGCYERWDSSLVQFLDNLPHHRYSNGTDDAYAVPIPCRGADLSALSRTRRRSFGGGGGDRSAQPDGRGA